MNEATQPAKDGPAQIAIAVLSPGPKCVMTCFYMANALCELLALEEIVPLSEAKVFRPEFCVCMLQVSRACRDVLIESAKSYLKDRGLLDSAVIAARIGIEGEPWETIHGTEHLKADFASHFFKPEDFQASRKEAEKEIIACAPIIPRLARLLKIYLEKRPLLNEPSPENPESK